MAPSAVNTANVGHFVSTYILHLHVSYAPSDSCYPCRFVYTMKLFT